MTHRPHSPTRPVRRALAYASLIALAGCAAPDQHPPAAAAGLRAEPAWGGAAQAPKPDDVVIDGDTRDWPADTVAMATEHDLLLRFLVPGEPFTLQASPKTVSLLLDVDADTKTGRRSDAEPLDRLGVDLEVQFSPFKKDAAPERGVRVFMLNSAGQRRELPRGSFDLAFAPTYASTWYEVRLSRTPGPKVTLPKPGLLTSGGVRGMITTLDAEGEIDGFCDVFEASCGKVCPSGERSANLEPPAKPQGAIRIVSYNVAKTSTAAKPQLFQRVFEHLKPDIILVQEWEQGDAKALAGWFTALVTSPEGWNAVKAPGDIASGGGVGIVSRYPLEDLNLRVMNGNKPVRFVGAHAKIPGGDLLLGSTHLKCCGSKDSPEDVQRMAEARAINGAFLAAGAKFPSAVRVITGDMNLVGSRPPLDLLRAGLDVDASDLSAAEPVRWGDVTMSTWRDANTEFTPGRLDYVLYSDVNAEVVNAFVFDTGLLTDEALARIGLDRTDCTGSDHLPVVVDVRVVR